MVLKPTSQIIATYIYIKSDTEICKILIFFNLDSFLWSKPFTWKLVSWPEVSMRPEFLLRAKSITVSLGRRAYAELTLRFHIALLYSCAAILTSLTSNIWPKSSLPPLYKFRYNAAFKLTFQQNMKFGHKVQSLSSVAHSWSLLSINNLFRCIWQKDERFVS
jgi:hypothetical protein